MSTRHDPDFLISAWVADATASGGPDYLPEVLAMVERTPQHRWSRWFPGAWTSSPAKPPLTRTAVLLVAAALLLIVLASVALVAGALRGPTFSLQGVVPVPGSVGVVFVGASDDAVWATVEDGVVAIDPETGAATRFEVPGGGTELTGVLPRPEAVWVADYHGDRVVRLDRATGKVTNEVPVRQPGNLQWEGGLWVQDGAAGGAARIDPATALVDLRLPDAISYAVAPGTLWYVATSGGDAFAVEVDPATGTERRRIAVPFAAADSITVDAAGNPWIWRRRSAASTVVAVDARTGTVGQPFDLPYDVIGGIVPIGRAVWGLTGPGTTGGARIVELGPAGPTGRVEPLEGGPDPDNPVLAFGSIWVPWDGKAALYRYPLDALAR